MLLFLSDHYRQSQKILFKSNMHIIPFRSHSHEQMLHHQRSDSNQSIDLFKLVLPKLDESSLSSLSSLTCSICSLPMMKPTLLPCQHTFCLKCLENNQQIRTSSLPEHSSNGYLLNDHRTKTITCQKCFRTHRINSLNDLEENQSMEFLINSLLCETCHQLCHSNQLDTCLHCFAVLCPNCYDDHLENHQIDVKQHQIVLPDQIVNNNLQDSDSQIFKPRSINNQRKVINDSTKIIIEIENNENETNDSSQINQTKKKVNGIFRIFSSPSRYRHSRKESLTKTPSIPVKTTCSIKTLRRTKLTRGIKIEGISNDESLPPSNVPITPVSRFVNLHEQYSHTAQHIQQCKQRQSELDRSVQKLIQVLTIKINETINQISFYWTYLKEKIFERYQPKNDRFQLFDYLLKTCCSPVNSHQLIESYFEENDDINAALQVLMSTLTIVNQQETLVTINQLFNREEHTTIRTLRRQLESLLSSYTDELSFIIERIHVYETRFSTWKNSNTTELDSITYEWTQIIEHDYPSLIEKISNDFITKIPQMEKLLLQMLRNMKKRLLNTNQQTPSRRTSDS